jgi:hypothetical protein
MPAGGRSQLLSCGVQKIDSERFVGVLSFDDSPQMRFVQPVLLLAEKVMVGRSRIPGIICIALLFHLPQWQICVVWLILSSTPSSTSSL